MQTITEQVFQFKVIPFLNVLDLIKICMLNKKMFIMLKPLILNHKDFYYNAVWQGPKNKWRYYSSPAILPDNIQHCFLKGADLWSADLWSADLQGANLTNANLTSVDLTNANLTGANLTSVDLTNANLTNTNVTNVITNENTVLPKGWEFIVIVD